MTTRLRKNGGVHQLIFVVLAALWLTVGARRVSATDWLMYGFNLQRTGENPFESILTPSTVGGLHELWSFDLGAVTIMQPVLATGVIVHGSPKDLVYMGAEHGDSIDPATGDVFTATGNALTNPESFRYSENVVELSSVLQVLGSNYPGLTGLDV